MSDGNGRSNGNGKAPNRKPNRGRKPREPRPERAPRMGAKVRMRNAVRKCVDAGIILMVQDIPREKFVAVTGLRASYHRTWVAHERLRKYWGKILAEYCNEFFEVLVGAEIRVAKRFLEALEAENPNPALFKQFFEMIQRYREAQGIDQAPTTKVEHKHEVEGTVKFTTTDVSPEGEDLDLPWPAPPVLRNRLPEDV